MRQSRFWPQMTLVVAFAVMNGGCVLIPEIKDRIVELAVAGTTSHVFAVQDNSTTLNEAGVGHTGHRHGRSKIDRQILAGALSIQRKRCER